MDDAVLFHGLRGLAVDIQIPLRTAFGRFDALYPAFGYRVVSGWGYACEKSGARSRPIVLCSSDGVAQSVADSGGGENEAVLLALLLR